MEKRAEVFRREGADGGSIKAKLIAKEELNNQLKLELRKKVGGRFSIKSKQHSYLCRERNKPIPPIYGKCHKDMTEYVGPTGDALWQCPRSHMTRLHMRYGIEVILCSAC